jgi:hypothetical protein
MSTSTTDEWTRSASQFSVLSADQILKRSACEVVSVDTYVNNVPVPGGLYDRMGVVDYDLRYPPATTTTASARATTATSSSRRPC